MRLLLKILLISLALGSPAFALGAPPQAMQLAQGGGKSLNQAVEQVRRQYPNGRIISAETKVQGGREVHHVRVMINGKVKTVRVNGRKRA